MFDVSWLRFLTGGQLPTAVIVTVVIVLALGYLIKAATPLVTIILHKPELGRRVQVERGRLKIVIEPQEEPKPNDTRQGPEKQLSPAPKKPPPPRRNPTASSPGSQPPRRAGRDGPS